MHICTARLTCIYTWTHAHSSGVASPCRSHELEVIREKYACLPVMSVIGRSTSKSRPVRMIWIKPAPIWKP